MTKKTFNDFDLDPALVAALDRQGITNPFPIQELTLPMALKGADIIGQARTGTGKTLAFGLPLLQRLDPDLDATQALVVVPTRELCLQVTGDLKIGAERGLTIQSVYGGVGYDDQIDALTGNVHIVVGTPGRLLDHLGRGNLDLSQLRVLVLDEADEMLDMGFLPDVERLIEASKAEGRHTMLFSATMPTPIVKLARRYMEHPTFMRADTEDHEVSPDVEQYFFLVHRMDKPRLLARILQTPGRGSVYVFTRTKRMADRLVQELGDLGVSAIAVHGDLRQATREKNMGKFRDGTTDVLVATEVAARGLDVEDATHVVNYDCPDDEKMYLHRIGRTARAGAGGSAITFGEFNEVDRLNVIRKAVEAERDIAEVFSTSDELAEWFDLPDETPWDHLARTSGGGKGSSRGSSKSSTSSKSTSSKSRSSKRPSKESSERTSDAASKDSSKGDDGTSPRARPPSRRRGRTDGRSQNARSREGARQRNRSDAGRQRQRARTEATDTSGQDSSGATSAHPPALGERDDAAEKVRTRTRDRTESGSSSRSSSKARAHTRTGDTRGDRGDDGAERSRNNGRTATGDGARREHRSSEGTTSQRGGDAEEVAAAAASDETPRGRGTPHLARRVKVEHLP